MAEDKPRARAIKTDQPLKLKMPPSARRVTETSSGRKNSDERWTEILQVSAKMFSERGYSATSLQAIADELGMLKGSLYYYIRTKDDLLYEVIRTVYWEGVANFHRLSSGKGTAAERLAKAIEGHVKHLTDNMIETTVFLHEFERLPEARRLELSTISYDDLVRDLIVDGQRDGSFKQDMDATLVSMAILGATNWVYRWYHESGPRKATEIGELYAQLFIAGLSR
ncbi:TetR/AcrR family transcriptional regulator [Williamsia muralis]|uniref:TetR/AcrR family transcriptional regulator n=1 Tax=Williamsia marianensis TaxID=85044 RepID=A0ABU4ERJ3_WILMA|nr:MULTISPECIES: TetR/AcrR family transcriptional regulator [Williamsia]MDV7133873.1 TetR/AcrR family transcriptional regulator [Williamsia muralis]PVY30189.1 TetR family transcriptional regulator [Williamsia marianensis]